MNNKMPISVNNSNATFTRSAWDSDCYNDTDNAMGSPWDSDCCNDIDTAMGSSWNSDCCNDTDKAMGSPWDSDCCNDTDNAKGPLFEVAHWALSEKIGIISGFALLVILITVGNLTIIVAVFKDSALQSSATNIFYVNLAIADLVVGVAVVPFMGVLVYLGYWPLGYLLCDLWLSVSFLCCTASFYTLTAISWDRFRAVCYPLDHLSNKSRRRAVYLVTSVWTAAVFVWVPAIFVVRKLSALYEDYYCLFDTYPRYVVVSCIIAYYIPIIVMLFLNCAIYKAIRRALLTPVKDERYVTDHCMSSVPERAGETTETLADPVKVEVSIFVMSAPPSVKLSRENRAEKQYRASVKLGVIMAAFLVCWCPLVVIWPLRSYWPSSIPLWLSNLALLMTYLNSLLNPFLYVFSNPSFQAAVKRLLFSKETRT